ncbi:accessory Sec system protein Asp3 [Staphylococcus microti]|uniref:Accessory Sec system protein Asp3 n=1 Tax=Staphylococcus microti TaxID=569857 RepID=A0A380GTJ4_9STAP|nr:accessory Sec system protein Asp3 [Staphylococcus microti]PNZ82145.1 accessory Sec system protein Asp3 [Staphylococcus microti]SUM56528.1 accessory Sec system protein Asp3 [Staphylococcus microti]
MLSNSHTIRWTQVTDDTFMYGTRLKFHRDGSVVFENALMPSSIVIHEWKMMTHFVADKTIPQLPILKHGQSYRFVLDYDVEPAEGVYFKVVFKKSNGTEIDAVIIREREAVITYPADAFSYELQMLNAAAKRVKFRAINIIEETTTTRAEALTISEIKQESEHVSVMNVIVVAEEGVSRDAIRSLPNVIMIAGWQLEDIGKIAHVLAPLQQGYALNFIGYTRETDVMAYQLAEYMRETAWVTTDEQLPTKSDVAVEVYGDIAPRDTELSLVSSLLHASHHLNKLDETVLNGGVRR